MHATTAAVVALVLALLALAGTPPAPALACSGGPDPVLSSDVIVAGRVTSMRRVPELEHPEVKAFAGHFAMLRVEVRVDRYLKGSGPSDIAVLDGASAVVLDTPDPEGGARRPDVGGWGRPVRRVPGESRRAVPGAGARPRRGRDLRIVGPRGVCPRRRPRRSPGPAECRARVRPAAVGRRRSVADRQRGARRRSALGEGRRARGGARARPRRRWAGRDAQTLAPRRPRIAIVDA